MRSMSNPWLEVGAVSSVAHSVRPSDLDSFGHVNNARVLEYCEFGRWHWVEERFSVASMLVVPVVSNYSVNYHAELFIGPIHVVTTLVRSQRYSVAFEHAVSRIAAEDERPAVVATATVCFLDRAKRRPVRVQEYVEQCLIGVDATSQQPRVSFPDRQRVEARTEPRVEPRQRTVAL